MDTQAPRKSASGSTPADGEGYGNCLRISVSNCLVAGDCSVGGLLGPGTGLATVGGVAKSLVK